MSAVDGIYIQISGLITNLISPETDLSLIYVHISLCFGLNTSYITIRFPSKSLFMFTKTKSQKAHKRFVWVSLSCVQIDKMA